MAKNYIAISRFGQSDVYLMYLDEEQRDELLEGTQVTTAWYLSNPTSEDISRAQVLWFNTSIDVPQTDYLKVEASDFFFVTPPTIPSYPQDTNPNPKPAGVDLPYYYLYGNGFSVGLAWHQNPIDSKWYPENVQLYFHGTTTGYSYCRLYFPELVRINKEYYQKIMDNSSYNSTAYKNAVRAIVTFDNIYEYINYSPDYFMICGCFATVNTINERCWGPLIGSNNSYFSNTWYRPSSGSWSSCKVEGGIISADLNPAPLFNEYPADSTGLNPGGSTLPNDSAIPGTTGGTWQLIQDPIPDTFPVVNSLATGLYRVFGMTLSNVQALGYKLWSPDIINVASNFIQKLFDSNLMNVVAGLIELPFSIESCCGAEQRIKFDWLDGVDFGTAVRGKPLETEYYRFYYDDLDMTRYSGMFFDYEPYSTVLIYLPYVGYRPLHATEIMNGTLSLEVRIHITTGDGVYVLRSTAVGSNSAYSGNGIIGQYPFNCAKTLPLSQQSYEKFYSTLFSMAGTAIGGIASAASGQFSAMAGDMAQDAATYYRVGMNHGTALAVPGQPNDWLMNDVSFSADSFRIGNRLANQAVRMQDFANKVEGAGNKTKQITNSISNSIAPSATELMRSGNVSPVTGRLNIQVPYLMVTHPELSQPITFTPGKYNQRLLGWATNISKPLSNFTGYTEVRMIDVSGTTATSEEYDELVSVLRNGIYITGGE